MSLQDWLRNGWLIEHQTSGQEIADLLGVIDRDLADCRTAGLSPDWQLSIAYNGAVQVAVAGLAAEGYRPARESHHHRAIQSLQYTLKVEPAVIVQLDAFRKKRNISDYERAGSTSQQEAGEIVRLAQRLRIDLEAWLRAEHPELLEAGA